jgi:hypothetical protein
VLQHGSQTLGAKVVGPPVTSLVRNRLGESAAHLPVAKLQHIPEFSVRELRLIWQAYYIEPTMRECTLGRAVVTEPSSRRGHTIFRRDHPARGSLGRERRPPWAFLDASSSALSRSVLGS